MQAKMMDNIQSRKIKVGKLDVHYFTGGQGEPLLLVHGGGNEGARDWLHNAAILAENYTVYVPDLPGFGHSQRLDGDFFIPELADFVENFSRALGLKKFHLLGHSLGGGIALHYALKFPQKITKLVLVNSMCLGKEIALWVRLLANPALCKYIGRATLAVLKWAKLLAESFLAASFALPFSETSVYLGSYVTTFKEQTTVFLHRLSEIMVPTLVVWGAKDPILPFKQAYAAAQLIPDCQVRVFADAGHSVYREEMEDFSRLLKGFLG